MTPNKRNVEALVPEDQPFIARDDKLTGFGIRVQPVNRRVRDFFSPRRRGEITLPVEAETVSEPNAESRYEVTRAYLPLSCPMPDMAIWSSHPMVYLPVEETRGSEVSLLRRRVPAGRPLGR